MDGLSHDHATSTTDVDVARWDAVIRRDGAADGQFVYSVRTTGVYCRPSCPSRVAKRVHVVFHATNADAEQAGYRPCKRCRPDADTQADRTAALVARACRLMEAAETIPRLDQLATAVGLSAFHFHRLFKTATGITPRAYASQVRAYRVAEALRDADTVTRAVYEGGFNSFSPFYAASRDRLGMTPTAFRDRGAGATIQFAVGACSFGAILVAATDLGICAITLGDDPEALVRDLQDRFAKADIVGGDVTFEAVVAHVIGFVEAPRTGLGLPLHIGGTAFQQRVWQALCAVPPGGTVTYRDVAKAIGAPSAVRAVASACGANALAVAIPCHRVVRTDGSLSGYRWGIERKRALIARESIQHGTGAPDLGTGVSAVFPQ
jgi:AraC family transcriptional regulator of adaptative response/methylated-DNA-[protein]-cysteine methyltransferase